MRRRGTLKKYADPDYAGMSNVVFHGRADGLVVNTTNSFGVVDVSGNVTKLISVDTTTHEFDSNGTAPTLTGTGIDAAIVFGGAGRLRHNGANSVFNNFHYRASINDLKWTIHGIVKFGTTSNPDAVYGLFGNNGGASGSKGINGNFDDRASVNLNENFSFGITRGVSASLITLSNNNNIFPANRYVDFWIHVDKSQEQKLQTRLFINGYEHTVSNRVDSVSMFTNPTYAMEIGGCGNATIPGILSLKEITFQDGIETDAFRNAFILARMAKYRIVPFSHQTDNIIRRTKATLIETFDDTRYYLPIALCQNQTDTNIIIVLLGDSASHVYDAAGKISMRKSTDKGRTFGAKTTINDPAGAVQAKAAGGCYDSTGRLHVIMDLHTAIDATSTNTMEYWYSDNDGTSWTSSDITANLASDALASWRIDGRMIENNGALMITYYKVTAEGDATESANYILRSTDGGATWTTITVRAKSTTYRNEACIVACSSTVLFVVVRDEVTVEWHQYTSTDNGLNWSAQGALSLGEALTQESPVIIRTLLLNGALIACVVWADRSADVLKCCYATAANLIASGLTGWNLATKHTLNQGSASKHYHYGDHLYPDNDMNGIIMFPYDPYPVSGPGTANVIELWNIQTAHYSAIKTLLGV